MSNLSSDRASSIASIVRELFVRVSMSRSCMLFARSDFARSASTIKSPPSVSRRDCKNTASSGSFATSLAGRIRFRSSDRNSGSSSSKWSLPLQIRVPRPTIWLKRTWLLVGRKMYTQSTEGSSHPVVRSEALHITRQSERRAARSFPSTWTAFNPMSRQSLQKSLLVSTRGKNTTVFLSAACFFNSSAHFAKCGERTFAKSPSS